MQLNFIVYLTISLAVVLISTILHEMAHGWTAYLLGDYTPKAQGRLSPNPLKHIDPILSIMLPIATALMGGPVFGGAKPVSINYTKLKGGDKGFALVAAAGPLTNLLLAYILFCITYYLNLSPDTLAYTILSLAVFINLGMFAFNIIPIPPLDGSRILYVLAPDFIKDFMRRMENTGGIAIVFLFVMFAGALFSRIIGGIISFIIEIFQKLVI